MKIRERNVSERRMANSVMERVFKVRYGKNSYGAISRSLLFTLEEAVSVEGRW